MLIDESRPKIFIKDIECQNISVDKKVFFLEDDHLYMHEDDIIDGKVVDFQSSIYKFKSPTGILSEFKEHFEEEKIARKYVIKHGLDITWKELVSEWNEKARVASEEGTLLHGYAESLWNSWKMDYPKSIKATYVDDMFKQLSESGILAKTELLVYSTILKIAGQVDLLLRNEDKTEYYLYDYKFIKRPLEKKSFYNPRLRKYKMMKGPFRKLYDSNFFHYSIQMEFYRYLMGRLGRKVTRKNLLVFTPEKWEVVKGYDISIWVNSAGILHAIYRDSRGELYDSSNDKIYLKKPFKII